MSPAANDTKTRTTKPPRPRAAPWTAFVLHRYDWSESSLILDLFTREGGRVAVAAKGAKRPTSQYRSVLLPFQRLHVTLTQRHNDDSDGVQTLRSGEWAGGEGGAAVLRGEALFRGFYLNELLMKLLPRGDAHASLFDAYTQTLAAFAQPSRTQDQTQADVRAFEMTLLREVGWLPDLSVLTATQEPLHPTRSYVLRADGGMVVADGSSAAIAGEHWLRMHAAQGDRAHDELRHVCEVAAAPLRTMLRNVLNLHLGHTTLKTRDVALGLHRLAVSSRVTAADNVNGNPSDPHRTQSLRYAAPKPTSVAP
jgi:DNA repair protein RecO (recombination protein O)